MYLNGHGLKWIWEIILRSNLWMTSALSKSLEITNMHVQGVSWNLSNNGGIFTCLAALSTFPPRPLCGAAAWNSAAVPTHTHTRANMLRVPATEEAVRPDKNQHTPLQ